MNRFLSTSVALALMCAAWGVTSCSKDETMSLEPLPSAPEEPSASQNYFINIFAFNIIDLYYLWVDEPQVIAKMNEWTYGSNPVTTVRNIRFKDAKGDDIDHWTTMVDNFEEAQSSLDGVEKTYGFDFRLYRLDDEKNVCAIVTYVEKGGPAEKAGWKRGDIIVKVNGKQMPLANNQYVDIVKNELLGGETLNATMMDGKERTLKSVTMQEDAVLMAKTFDCQGKKVGYMVYNSFTFDSIERLIEECKKFKADGIKELILDLRYNGGGYGITAEALASMLAPETEVKAGSLMQVEVMNKRQTELYKERKLSTETYFGTEFTYTTGGVKKTSSTEDANIGISKLYVLTTDGTASASEALICSLKPYMPVELIGDHTYGKYCGGYMIGAQNFYKSYKDVSPIKEQYEEGYEAVKGWGIYVMFSRYADKDGNTGCMPDGFTPDVKANDVPYDGHQLGDPEESLLHEALKQAGYQFAATAQEVQTRGLQQAKVMGDTKQVRKPNFGRYIMNE